MNLLSCLLVIVVCCSTVYCGCGPNHFLPIIEEDVCAALEDCRLNCMFELVKNNDGCEVCECRYHPCTKEGCKFPRKIDAVEKSCEEVGDCDRRESFDGGLACPNTVCQMQCLYGLQKGPSGCRLCVCATSPCNSYRCKVGQRCVSNFFACSKPPCDPVPKCFKECPYLEECKKTCNITGFKMDKDECRMCECRDKVCDDVKCPVNQNCISNLDYTRKYQCACDDLKSCRLSCPYGYHTDINGCAKCLCVKDPCEGVKCPEKLTCKPRQINVCLRKPCPFKGKCV